MSIYYNDEENHYELYLNEVYNKRYRIYAIAVYDGTLEITYINLLPDINGTGRLYDVPEEDYTRYAEDKFWEMITPEALDKARQDLIDSYQDLIAEHQAQIDLAKERINAINA